jgi:hypothetical protein
MGMGAYHNALREEGSRDDLLTALEKEWTKVVKLQARLNRIMELHGNGEHCKVCGMDWACETWRIAEGKEDG